MMFFTLATAAGLITVAQAAHFPIVARNPPSLARRGNLLGQTGPLTDTLDTGYTTKITLNGASYTVLIDTGSSDLWVSGKAVPKATKSGKSTSIEYAVGAASGPIEYASLEFAGYTVPKQAYIAAKGPASQLPAPGIIGLGPFMDSNIYNTLTTDNAKPQGLPPLENIFRQKPTVANYLTVLLGRVTDPNNNYPGDLTIMETLPGYEGVLNQPHLSARESEDGDQHWSVLIDSDGVIGPDGNAIMSTTIVDAIKTKSKLTAAFDTGFSFPQVPTNVAEGFYGKVPGAKLQTVSGVGKVWTMPCTAEVNIAFKIGGVTYPVHPLDATMTAADAQVKGLSDCMGTFQPMDPGAVSPDLDMVLGMAFLRNVYLLVNYGNDFKNEVTGSHVLYGTGNTAAPYIQMLSTSNNTAQMHADFIKARGTAAAASTAPTSTTSASGATKTTAADLTSDKQVLDSEDLSFPSANATAIDAKAHQVEAKVKKIAIISGIVGAAFILLLIGCCCMCLCRRRRNKSRGVSSTIPGMSGTAGSYRPLQDPAPAAAVDVHATQHGGSAFTPPQYQDAWDHKY